LGQNPLRRSTLPGLCLGKTLLLGHILLPQHSPNAMNIKRAAIFALDFARYLAGQFVARWETKLREGKCG